MNAKEVAPAPAPAPPPPSEFNAVDVRSPPLPSLLARREERLDEMKLEAWERRASQSRPAAPAPCSCPAPRSSMR